MVTLADRKREAKKAVAIAKDIIGLQGKPLGVLIGKLGCRNNVEFFSHSYIFGKAFSCKVSPILLEGKALEDATSCYCLFLCPSYCEC